MGRVSVVGVPGADGAGEPIAIAESVDGSDRKVRSGGAGLWDEIRLEGRSAFAWFAIRARVASWSKVKCPSLVFNE